ncbi:MAG: AAA family ATPase [Myxococcota bacterium]|nr:AAA family ATPase [Myxococcota bacterium]
MQVGEPRIRIDEVELHEELGWGATSVVRRGVRRGSSVAVKIARGGGRAARWFRREAAALARVDHEGLPRVLEVGESDGVPWLVMELVRGPTLAERLAEGRPPEGEALSLAVAIADTLDAVHRRGVVHCDVKPQNVVLDGGDRVRLVDFGFATPERLSPEGAGTPPYAAPEQTRGARLVDARTDLHALGRVLLECLTGDPLADLDSVPAPLAVVLGGLLAPEPADRYPSARAVVGELERLRAGEAPLGPASPLHPAVEAFALVGRDAELARLRELWRGSSAGWGEVVLVEGPRGAGKSRLVRELVREIEAEGGRVIHHACAENDPRPLAALRAIFEQAAAALRRDEAARADLRGRLGPDLAAFAGVLCPELAELLGADASYDAGLGAEAFTQAVADLVLELAASLGPLCVVADDGQWMDRTSAEVLTRVADRIGATRLLLAVATRAGEGRTSPALPRLVLTPFDGGRTAALVSAHLGHAVSEELVAWVARVSDGTPLGIVEVLDAMLDAATLRPVDEVWRFDRARAEQMHLPRGALALMERRVGALPPAARRVFESAALLGRRFDAEVLADLHALSLDDLEFALADARRAGLVEADAPGGHRFVHDAVREALLAGLDDETRATLNQRIARCLDGRGGASPFTLAAHYAAGRPREDRGRLLDVAEDALAQLIEDHDDEAALRLFDAIAASMPDAVSRLEVFAGEAATRLGDGKRALRHFESALDSTLAPDERARLRGRRAWVHQQAGDADAAWAELERAFYELGERMPVESPRAVAGSAWRLARAEAGPPASGREAERLSVLCDLHYQNVRLGEEYEKPLRLIQSTARAYALSRRLPPSAARARSEALVATALAILGRRDASTRHAEEAMRIARGLGRPPVLAFCEQMRAMASYFGGDFDRGLDRLHDAFGRHERWMEAAELCLFAVGVYTIEAIRGQYRYAPAMLRRSLSRARRLHAPPPALVLAEHCERASEATLTGVAALAPRAALSGFNRTAAWGPITHAFLELDELGPELEAHLAEFDALGLSPRTAHPVVFEHYVSLAYIRLRQATRGPDRRAPLRALKRALKDVRAAARFPLFRAHALVLEGAVRWLEGDAGKARALLAEADAIADAESCLWARFEAERLRAHMLRAEGRRDSARQRASLALAIAREAKAAAWERLVRGEFELPRASSARGTSIATSQASHRRQLQTLLHIFEVATRQPAVEEQGRLFLDEVMDSLAATRGLLVFDAESSRDATLLTARQRAAEWPDPPPEVRALIDGAREAGMPRSSGESDDAPRAVAVPLWLRGRVVGGVYLERDGDEPPFEEEDFDVLFALSYQVSVALQLARTMRDRERLEQSLRQAQKMEAIGRLAGGIAHDFNNMLTVMVGTIQLLSRKVDSADAGREVDMLAQVTDRASRLTNQLLAFSRQSSTQLEVFDVDDTLEALAPMLRRLIGDQVRVVHERGEGGKRVHLDRGLLDQAVVNLALNARDAMEGGGRLVLRSRGEAGRVLIEVEDDGAGMSREVRENALEPFFTTKERGKGTGLGLAMVYGFVEQSGGTLEIDSELGRGTLIRIAFPETEEKPALRSLVISNSKEPEAFRATRSGEMLRTTVLVVDDDPLVLQTLALGLEPEGYRVVAAETPDQALRLADALDRVDVIVSDVMMPDMNGPELVDALAEVVPEAAVLFVSGYADTELRETMDLKSRSFLRKPFRPEQLCEAVRDTLRRRRESDGIQAERIPVENGT